MKKVLISVLAVLVILAASVGFGFRNEIMTINSIKKVDNRFYTMKYYGDYGFDDFLKIGASNDTKLVEFVTKRLLKGVSIKIKTPDLSCSSFNAATPNGDYIFGRNFDMNNTIGMLVYTKPDNGYKSISMVNLAFVGDDEDDDTLNALWNKILAMSAPYIPLDGINEKGLAVGILQIPDDKPTWQNTGKVDITSTTAIRMLLDKASTVDEAITMLKKYDMHSSANGCYHYQITDATGNSVIVEYVDNEMHVLKPDGKYQAATNFYLTPGKKFNFGGGQDRYQIVINSLKEKVGVMTTQDGINLLEKARMHNWKDPRTSVIYNTAWSAVYNNTHKCVDLAVEQKYEKVYHYTVDK